jgi:5-methylcytosine-specific restriction endonuclease McrA
LSERKSISKKTRFEVFKRDGFACQYCGAHPPEVTLEVDHIVPVAEGGPNEFDNYITACFPCNRGKGAVSLDRVPQSLSDKAAEIAEREAQLRGYNDVMQAKRNRLDADVDAVNRVYERFAVG